MVTTKSGPGVRGISSILMATLIILCAQGAHAGTWVNVTVVTSGGWEYTDMTVVCEPGDDSITLINADKGRKKVNTSNIQTIRDRRGVDITAQVLSCATGIDEMKLPSELPSSRVTPPSSDALPKGESMNRIQMTPVEKTKKGARNSFEPRFRLSPTLGAGYSITSGDWFEGFTSGMLLDIAARFAVKNDMFMGFAFRRQNLGVKEEWKTMCFYDDFGNYMCVNMEWDVVLKEMYFLLGFMTTPRKYSTPIGYGELGIGAIQHDIQITAYYEGIGESGDSDETKFAMMWGGGVLFPLNRRIGIDLEIHCRLTGDIGSSYPYRKDITGFLFGFQAGIVFFVGGD